MAKGLRVEVTYVSLGLCSPLPLPLAGMWWFIVMGRVQKVILKRRQSNKRDRAWDTGWPLGAQPLPVPGPNIWTIPISQIYLLTNTVGLLRGLQKVSPN